MAVQLLQLVAEIHQDRDSGLLPVFDVWAGQLPVSVFVPRQVFFLRRLIIKQILRFAQDDRKQRGHFTSNVASFFSNLHSSGTLARLMQIE